MPLARPWYGTGPSLVRHWPIPGTALAHPWYGTGPSLVRHWPVPGMALARPWYGTRPRPDGCVACHAAGLDHGAGPSRMAYGRRHSRRWHGMRAKRAAGMTVHVSKATVGARVTPPEPQRCGTATPSRDARDTQQATRARAARPLARGYSRGRPRPLTRRWPKRRWSPCAAGAAGVSPRR
jgi:hypothetical protein